MSMCSQEENEFGDAENVLQNDIDLVELSKLFRTHQNIFHHNKKGVNFTKLSRSSPSPERKSRRTSSQSYKDQRHKYAKSTPSSKDHSMPSYGKQYFISKTPISTSCSNVTVHTEQELAPQLTSDLSNICLNNISPNEPHSNTIAIPHVNGIACPNVHSGSWPFHVKCKTFGPSKARGFLQNSKAFKQNAAFLKFGLQKRNDLGHCTENKNSKHDLTAWKQYTSSSIDDFSLLKKAVYRSPPHSFVSKPAIHKMGIGKAKKCHNEKEALAGVHSKLSDKSEESEYSSDSGNKQSDTHTSDKWSHSDPTLSIWSKLSGNDSERTSIGIEWESQSHDELQPSLSQQDYDEQKRVQLLSDAEDKLLISSFDQQCFRNRFRPPMPPSNRLLQKRPQLSIHSEEIMDLPISKPTKLSKFRRSNSSRHMTEQTDHHDDLSLSNSETEISLSNDINVTKSRSLARNKSVGTDLSEKSSTEPMKPCVNGPGSHPATTNYLEHSFLQVLVMSEIMQKLFCLQKKNDHETNFTKQIVQSARSKCPANTQRIVRNDVRTVVAGSEKRATSFRSYNENPYQILKWTLFVVLVTAVIIMCVFLASLATVSALFDCDILDILEPYYTSFWED